MLCDQKKYSANSGCNRLTATYHGAATSSSAARIDALDAMVGRTSRRSSSAAASKGGTVSATTTGPLVSSPSPAVRPASSEYQRRRPGEESATVSERTRTNVLGW